MQKNLRMLLIIVTTALVVLQFFRPEKNASPVTSAHLFEMEKIPENIQSILKNSCFDCHSNQTRYLWYHQISPVSWMVNRHITEGKKELNFSDWGQLDDFSKIGHLEKICREAELKKMPLKAYTAMHPKARLTDEQIAALCAWTETMGEKLLTQNLKE
jgi:hypothetical protein